MEMGETWRRREIIERLAGMYPGRSVDLCALKFETPFQLLVATILSAQCTDARVNAATVKVFETYPSPVELSTARLDVLESLIYSTGFYKNKARNLLDMAKVLVSSHGGKVPDSMEALASLPGVGRKTANVVLSVAYDKVGLPVDTHVLRLSRRLGLTAATDPVKVERDLMTWVPESGAGVLSLRLILHGRETCLARKPKCELCVLAELCPSASLG